MGKKEDEKTGQQKLEEQVGKEKAAALATLVGSLINAGFKPKEDENKK